MEGIRREVMPKDYILLEQYLEELKTIVMEKAQVLKGLAK